jgi:hypothetical protein
MRAALLLALVAAGCGRGSDGALGGGDENLPVSGAGPFRPIRDRDFSTPLDEPMVITLPGTDLTEPAALDAGDTLRVYYSRGGAIWRSDLAATLRALPEEPAMVLAASEPWEAGAVRAPALVDEGDRVVLYYEGGAGGVGRAESDDGGDTFVKTGLVLEGGASPAALRAGDRWFLYFTRADAPGIFVALSDDGVAFAPRAEPVLAAGASPAVAGGITASGALRVALYFDTPGERDTLTIGHAGSADGVAFETRAEPILDPDPPAERAAAVLLRPSRAILFYAQTSAARLAIAAATSP